MKVTWPPRGTMIAFGLTPLRVMVIVVVLVGLPGVGVGDVEGP